MHAIPESTAATIHALWDALADARYGSGEASLLDLLSTLSDLVGAQNAWWMGVVRVPSPGDRDPLDHWRPGAIRYLHEEPRDRAFYERAERMLAERGVDETMVINVRGAGTFRVNWLSEMVSEEWWDSPFCQLAYTSRGITDAIFVCTPVNPDVVAFLGFQRKGLRGDRFDRQALTTLEYALRGLRWFQRQQLLDHGLLIARSALTPTERRVLGHLLTDLSEAKIALVLGLARPTIHNHISTIYRKFGVRSRAGLMALWLGQGGR